MKVSAPITISVLLALTAGLPAVAQTGTEQPPAPAWPAEETVCPWDNVNDNPRLARVCLQAAGVNTGLAEYAFAEEPWDYDPDTPTPSGTPEEAGLVSRWAMGEAIHRMIETAVETAGGQTPALPANHRPVFTDIGWLGEDTRRKLELLFHWGITTGTNVYGEYSPTQTVTRAQMARFFVRSLAAIDRFTEGEGTPGFTADDTWQTLGRETDAFEIPVPFADVQAGKPPAGILDRGLLGAVSILYDLGITRGAGSGADGNPVYRPELNVSGDQMAMFLVRLLAHTSIRPEVSEETPDLTAVELPEIQQDGFTVKIDGSRFPDGYQYVGLDVLIQPDPSTRPPREFDVYRYHPELHPDYRDVWERVGIYDGGQLMRLTSAFSLQLGDWYWNSPHGLDERYRSVFVELRTSVLYVAASDAPDPRVDPFPVIRALVCSVSDENPDDTRYGIVYMLRVGAGLFRLSNYSAVAETVPEGNCDPADYGFPEPPGGYTENFPCDGTYRTSGTVRKLFGDALKPCGT